MGDDQGGAALGQPLQGVLDHPLAVGVQGAGGLVKNQNGRIFEEHPGYGNSLLLSAGKAYPVRPYIRVISLGQLLDELVRSRFLGRGDNLFLGAARPAVGDVLPDGAREQVHVLLYHTDVLPQGAQGGLFHRQAVQQNLTLLHLVEPGDEGAQGGFPHAGSAHQGHILPGLNGQIQPVEYGSAAVIGEGDAPQLQIALDFGKLPCLRAVLDFRGRFHHLPIPGKTGNALLQKAAGVCKAAHRTSKIIHVQHKKDEIGQRHGPRPDSQPPKHRHRDGQQVCKGVHAAVKPGLALVAPAAALQETLVLPVKLFLLDSLVCEGLYHPHAGKGILHLGVDIPRAPAALGQGLPHFPAVVQGVYRHKGQKRQNCQGDLPVDGKQNRRGSRKLEGVHHHVLGEVVEKFCQG